MSVTVSGLDRNAFIICNRLLSPSALRYVAHSSASSTTERFFELPSVFIIGEIVTFEDSRAALLASRTGTERVIIAVVATRIVNEVASVKQAFYGKDTKACWLK